MTKHFATLGVATLMVAFSIASVLAQDTTVTIPYGNWISAVLPFIGFIVLLGVIILLAYVIKFLPPWAQSLVAVAGQKELIGYAKQAINTAVMATQGAVKDKEIKLDVGNPLVAKAVQTAIDTWPQAAIDKLGGVDGVKKFVISQLEDHGVVLPPDATTDEILASPEVSKVKANP